MAETDGPTERPGWYVDESDPENPFGWTDDGDVFSVYRKGISWHRITTRRRWWWERRIKGWVGVVLVLAGLGAWATGVGALRAHHHVFYATVIGVGPLMWGWGYVYGKSRG